MKYTTNTQLYIISSIRRLYERSIRRFYKKSVSTEEESTNAVLFDACEILNTFISEYFFVKLEFFQHTHFLVLISLFFCL